MRWRYIIAALPLIVTIAVGWIMPLLIYGDFAFASDGGGRVFNEKGVCCVEPTAYFVARVAAWLSPVVFIASLPGMAVIWGLSRKR